ncbi:MAG: hypothetical protein ABL930_00960 [Pseudobdellovibrio sp.]
MQTSESQLVYTYSKLKLLDLDQMGEIIQDKLRRFKKSGRETLIVEAISISLSRPNDDSVAEKLLDTIRHTIEAPVVWESSLGSVVQTSIDQLKNETVAPEDQVTYLIILENLVSEFKPQFIKQYQSPKFETRTIEKIAGAQIEVSESATAESRLNLMREQLSPSTLAQSLIIDRELKLNPKK